MKPGKKKKGPRRIRKTNGLRMGRMSCRILYANTIKQATASLSAAEYYYREAEHIFDKRARDAKEDEAQSHAVGAARYLLSFLHENGVDVVEVAQNFARARAEEHAL